MHRHRAPVIYDACCNLWRLFLAMAISPQFIGAVMGQSVPLTGMLPWLQWAVILEKCNPIYMLPGVHLAFLSEETGDVSYAWPATSKCSAAWHEGHFLFTLLLDSERSRPLLIDRIQHHLSFPWFPSYLVRTNISQLFRSWLSKW